MSYDTSAYDLFAFDVATTASTTPQLGGYDAQAYDLIAYDSFSGLGYFELITEQTLLEFKQRVGHTVPETLVEFKQRVVFRELLDNYTLLEFGQRVIENVPETLLRIIQVVIDEEGA